MSIKRNKIGGNMSLFFYLYFFLLTGIYFDAVFAQASNFTQSHNKQVLTQLPFDNTQDFIDARKGFIAPLAHNGIIKNKAGDIVWDLAQYDFVKDTNHDENPDTVNPSLWRQARLLTHAGLYKVAPRVYQIRSADISNMTIIEGKSGLIIIDVLLSTETARAALDLYFEHRPKKDIKAVLYTHSHVDHFGGIKGIVSQYEVTEKKIRIIAPAGFTNAVFDENVLVGNVMARRASYMYGNLLPKNAHGQVSAGLGLTTSNGTSSLILPTEFITKTGEQKIIDGLTFTFINAPGSEAPAEMLFFITELQALGIAEDANHTMHNLYTLRGAKTRDARAWADYLNQALELFGADTKVLFGQHHWPVWGNKKVQEYLENQRDVYKYIHDQTLRFANQGYTPTEIAEKIKLPKNLAQQWYNRGYYGSLNHNSKAVYDFYLGWFDGNPAHLHELPEREAGKKYVEYMGGPSELMRKAQIDFNAGNYRWVAQLLSHLIAAQPEHKEGRELLAKALEQLGYQTENGTWRNFYLSGAQELKKGVKKLPIPDISSPDVVDAIPTKYLFDYLAIRLNGERAAENPLSITLHIPDKREIFYIEIKNGVLHYFTHKRKTKSDATIKINRTDLNKLFLKQVKLSDLKQNKKIKITGNPEIVHTFISLFDTFDFWFNIVELQK
jgi:alkyl sulfatase BDS1-like metallo-beta-lactamase superfamily hydrolase